MAAKEITTEKEARLTELKRELVKSVVQSRYWNSKTSTYAAPTRAIPARVKKLLKEIEQLEKETNATHKP